ncbi:MAG: TlpA disulfide reductase family protein [Turneriella sp.]
MRRAITIFICLAVVPVFSGIPANIVTLRDLPRLAEVNPPLPSFAGRPLLIVLWAVWCEPCAAELPQIETLRKEVSASPLGIAGIAVASPDGQARTFISRAKTTFPHYLDSNSEFADALGVAGVPAVILLHADGSIAFMQSGYENSPAPELREKIRSIIKLKGNNDHEKNHQP